MIKQAYHSKTRSVNKQTTHSGIALRAKYIGRSHPDPPQGSLSVSKRYSGKIPYRSISNGPSHEFSSIYREGDSMIEDKVKTALTLRVKKLPSTTYIVKNRDMSNNFRDLRDKYYEKRLQKSQIRQSLSKEVRKNIFTKRKAELQYKFNEKLRRFELRMRPDEATNCKHCWVILHCAIGVVSNSYKIIQNRKRMIQITEKSKTFFKLISRFIGKMKVSLLRTRKKHMIKRIYTQGFKYIFQWIQMRKAKYCDTIAHVLEEWLTNKTFVQLLPSWQQRLKTIQVSIKKLLEQRRNTYEKYIMMWDELQKFRRKPTKRSKKSLKTSDIEIPEMVKKIYIRQSLQNGISRRVVATLDKQAKKEMQMWEDLLKQDEEKVNKSYYNFKLG